MNKYKDLEPKILDWADDNDMLAQDLLLQQSNRVRRDIDSLHMAVIFKSKGQKEFYNEGTKLLKVEDELSKGLGKILFDLIILAEISGVSLEDALAEAYKNKK